MSSTDTNSKVVEPKHEEWSRSLDDKFYDPDPEALAFYKKETGIEDDEELKQHILRVQKEAFGVSCSFLHLSFSAWSRYLEDDRDVDKDDCRSTITRAYAYSSLCV